MTQATPLDLLAKPATTCSMARFHRPAPLRFVWHHIQPKQAGGKTETGNLTQVCDNCHYSIHRLLYLMATKQTLPKHSKNQYLMAKMGYDRCVEAGTVAKIPNEG